jgi:hypothetical protein
VDDDLINGRLATYDQLCLRILPFLVIASS